MSQELWRDAETYYNETRRVSLEGMTHRVSTYAILVENNHILMVKTHNNRWYFPGGGLNVGESLQDGLKREAWEELGIEIEVGELLHADDMVYYHDPVDKSSHLVRLYFLCTTAAQDFHFQNAEERDEFLEIGWVPLDNLNPDEFLPSTLRSLHALKKRLDGTKGTN